MTVKELKRKLNGFPATSDRGYALRRPSPPPLLYCTHLSLYRVLLAGNKNIKDTDKFGALGLKGKKGDTVKYSFTFELPGDAYPLLS